MKVTVKTRFCEFIRKIAAKKEELIFQVATCKPTTKLQRKRKSLTLLIGASWLVMGLHAFQEWAIAASTACISTFPSCASGCITLLSTSYACCATLLNASGVPIACCQFQCTMYSCIPPSSSSGVTNCSGSGIAQLLLGTFANQTCTSAGTCSGVSVSRTGK